MDFFDRAIAQILACRPHLPFRVLPPEGERRAPSLTLAGLNGERDVFIDLDDEEYTVAFGSWHTHADELEGALEVLDEIVSEKKVLMTAFCDERWRLSQLEVMSDETWLDFITQPYARDPPNRFLAWSWSGRLDREHHASQKT